MPISQPMDAVIFALDDVRYAVPAADVVEIVRAVAVTPLPGTPGVVEGLINLRGTLVPVFDVRARFGHAPRPPSIRDRLVIARARRRLAALRADRVDAVSSIAPSDIDDPRAHVAAAPQLRGVAKLEDGLVLIHDVHAFLSDAEEATLDAAMAAADAGRRPAAER